MDTIQKICICCPAGCHLELSRNQAGEVTVSGNRCPRGKEYGKNELTDPRRVLTAVVRTDSALHPCLPVKSSAPLPKAEIPALLKKLFSLRVSLPVEAGTVILPDCSAGNINIIATRSFK